MLKTLFLSVRRTALLRNAQDQCSELQGRYNGKALKLGLFLPAFVLTVLLTNCGAGYSTGPPASSPTSQHSVDLSWAASTSSNVSGYNVYRAAYSSSCGPFSRINSALLATTSYTDSTVTNGASYCYAATAVNTNEEESGYSNIVTNIQIPTN